MPSSAEIDIFTRSPRPVAILELREGIQLLLDEFGESQDEGKIKFLNLGGGGINQDGTWNKINQFKSTWDGKEGCVGMNFFVLDENTQNPAEPYEKKYGVDIHNDPFSSEPTCTVDFTEYEFSRPLNGERRMVVGIQVLKAWDFMLQQHDKQTSET
jgi:hypothetical protein